MGASNSPTRRVSELAEEKQAQDLRDREARTRAILETVVDGIVTIDARGSIETFNPAAERIFGYSAGEVVGQNIKMLMPAPYREEHDGYLHSYLTTGVEKVIGVGREVEGQRKNGSTFPMELAVSEMEVAGKRMFTGIVRDITKRIERAEREAFLKEIMEELDDSVAVWSADEHLIFSNKTFRELNSDIADLIGRGGTYEQILREGLTRGLFPAAGDNPEEWLRTRISEHRDPREVVDLKRQDGTVRQISIQRLSNGVTIHIGTDVTQKRKLAEDLRVAMDRFTDFASVSSDWLWEQDSNLRFTFMSPTNDRESELDQSVFMGKTRRETIVSGVSEAQWAEHDRILARREPLLDFRVERSHTDGERRVMLVRGRPFVDSDGNFAGYRGTGQDITEHERMIRKLAENEARLRTILETSPIAVTMVSIDGKFEYANERTLKLLGMTREETTGIQASATYADPNDRDDIIKIVKRDGQIRDHEVVLKTGNGGTVPVLMSVQPAGLGDDQLIGWAIDISNHKAIERTLIESQKLFQDFAESSSDWFWETDAEHKYTYISENFDNLRGSRAVDLIGTSRTESLRRQVNEGLLEPSHLDDVEAHRPFRNIRFSYKHADGSIGWVSASGRPVFDGAQQFAGYRGTGNDISEQVALEIALRKASDDARAANMAKSQFLSSMSHELRTPLNSILGFGQLLDMDAEHGLADDQSRSVEQILKSGNHLLELIDHVLDLSQIEQGHLSVSIEEHHPGGVIDDCVALIEQQARQRGLELKRSGLANSALPTVSTDRVRMKQVLLNLLMNAVKYNTTGKCVGFDCKRTPEGALRFEVWDDGLGIPLDKHDDIFKPFNRLGMESLGIEGTGIGLAISKELAGLMNGALGFFPREGGGAVFWFEVPLSETTSKRELRRRRPELNLPKESGRGHRKVLYIEDNPANLALMERVIAQLGNVEMLSAHTAELGLITAHAEKPDLVLMDINLPGMIGIEAMRALRAWPKLAETPVVAISAAAMPHDLEAAHNAGFAHYLTKPLDVPLALRVIDEMLRDGAKRH